jgi:putative sigma-54 modulation protein
VIGSGSVGAVSGLEIIEDISHDIQEFTVEEAIVVMEDGERNFLLFNNKESGKLNLVYGRPDGNYGLIEKF